MVSTLDEPATMTDARVESLVQRIQEMPNPEPLIPVVVDPNSFTKTVENIFDLTCAMKLGRAGISVDPSKGVPVIGNACVFSVSTITILNDLMCAVPPANLGQESGAATVVTFNYETYMVRQIS